MIEEVAPAQAAEIISAQWRRWRAPATLVVLILLGGVVIGLMQSSPGAAGPLDPRDTTPAGAHALVALLAGRGQSVTRAGTVADAVAQSRAPGATLVVTSPDELSPHSLAALGRLRADLLLVAPGPPALAALAPRVAQAGQMRVRSLPTGCALPAARMAGPALMGGHLLRAGAPGVWRCYRAPSAPSGSGSGSGASPSPPASLVSYSDNGRIITVLGTGVPLSNEALGQDGDAALALNLLARDHRVVWLVPGPGALPVPAGASPRSADQLVPPAVKLVACELLVVALLTAAWRVRRFGPLVAEPLPVVVRASETVRGHGRLYRARHARDRAAAVLRAGAIARIVLRLGLPADLPPAALCRDVAARTRRDYRAIEAILLGPAPADDAALVALASDLDILEGQVLSR